MEFKCIQDCSQCCIEREYYPSKKFGKIGVLILPEEKQRIEKLARQKEIKINILPRIGISYEQNEQPTVLAYQMMGVENNGNTCPFLDTKTENRSPHGGYPCRVYVDRPLACMAFPLVQTEPIELDEKCKFCKEHGFANEGLNSEMESLLKIQTKMKIDAPYIWRFATGIGKEEDKNQIKTGWILDE
ncbi:MAG: YkgJ family cysteine cluster protein [Nitrosopumilus sp.]|nr:YkgJ family cysteine cluster protein [Nitrosopumilus sp.]